MTEIEQGTMGGIAAAHLVDPPEQATSAGSPARPVEVSLPDPPTPTAAESNGTHMPALAADVAPPVRTGPTPRVLWPTELDDEDPPEPAPATPRRPVAWLRGAYAAAAFVGAFGAYAVLGPRRAASGSAEAKLLPVEIRLDARADTLARALAAFDLRAQLFEARQMTCEDLARGLVQIDDQWIAYNAVRKVAPATLDSVRTAHDRAAEVKVRAAERRFERSDCARP